MWDVDSTVKQTCAVLTKCHVKVTKLFQKNTSAKCNKFNTFRQQLLAPSSGIGNGYSDIIGSVVKIIHIDILPKGFSLLDVKQNQNSRCIKSFINISRFPPFYVPTKRTNSTWYWNSHFAPTCFGITMPSSSSTLTA